MKNTENEIIDVVRENGMISINEMYAIIGGNRNTLIKTYKKMIKEGHLELKEEGNKKFLTQKNTDFDKYFENFDSRIEFDIDMAFREILALRQYKPVCKIQKDTENALQYWVNPKARPHLKSISGGINRMFARTATLTYSETMNLIPKKYSKKIQNHNKKCLDAVKKITSKLLSEHQEYKKAIQSIISWDVYGYKMLSQIETLSKTRKKSFIR